MGSFHKTRVCGFLTEIQRSWMPASTPHQKRDVCSRNLFYSALWKPRSKSKLPLRKDSSPGRMGKEDHVPFYLYSITTAIAAVISSIVLASTVPILSRKRSKLAPRNCSVSIEEGFVRPFIVDGWIGTCQALFLNASFHPVIGAINLSFRLPRPSELTTTTGRVFCISSPTALSSATHQISPL